MTTWPNAIFRTPSLVAVTSYWPFLIEWSCLELCNGLGVRWRPLSTLNFKGLKTAGSKMERVVNGLYWCGLDKGCNEGSQKAVMRVVIASECLLKKKWGMQKYFLVSPYYSATYSHLIILHMEIFVCSCRSINVLITKEYIYSYICELW